MGRDASTHIDADSLHEIGLRARSLAERAARPGTADPGVLGSDRLWSSASPILTTLRFGYAEATDRVAVADRLLPLCLALEYLAGTIDLDRHVDLDVLESTIWRLRPLDTNPLVPLVAATADRATGSGYGRRQIAVVTEGDLVAGRVWETLVTLPSQGLGRCLVVVDLKHRRGGSVAPDSIAIRTRRLFSDAGWHVIEARHGRLRQEAFSRPGGDLLRHHIESIDSATVRDLATAPPEQIRDLLLEGADWVVAELLQSWDDDDLSALLLDFGGHDPSALVDCFRACDGAPDRPSVVFAHTTGSTATSVDFERDRFEPTSAPGRLIASVGLAARENREDHSPVVVPMVPTSVGTVVRSGLVATAEVLGPLIRQLHGHEVGRRLVRVCSLPTERAVGLVSGSGTSPRRRVDPGDSGSVLLSLVGELGLDLESGGEVRLPLGLGADLEATDLSVAEWYLALGSRFVVVDLRTRALAVPWWSGHDTGQAITAIRARTYDPAFATELDWILCDSLDRIVRADGDATVIRVTRSRLGQEPFGSAFDRLGGSRLRRLVLAGGYRLVEPASADRPSVTIIGSGPAVSAAVTAAAELETEGVAATVVNLTAPDLLAREWHRIRAEAVKSGRPPARSHIGQLVSGPARLGPLVTVHEVAGALEWIGGALGMFQVALGADAHPVTDRPSGVSPDHIVNATLVALAAKP